MVGQVRAWCDRDHALQYRIATTAMTSISTVWGGAEERAFREPPKRPNTSYRPAPSVLRTALDFRGVVHRCRATHVDPSIALEPNKMIKALG